MKIFETKIGRKWEKVQSESIKSLSEYCKNNNLKDWRMVGMQSRDEILGNRFLRIVGE